MQLRGICTPEYHRSRQKRVQFEHTIYGVLESQSLPVRGFIVHILLYQALWRLNNPLGMESGWILCSIISMLYEIFSGHWG